MEMRGEGEGLEGWLAGSNADAGCGGARLLSEPAPDLRTVEITLVDDIRR